MFIPLRSVLLATGVACLGFASQPAQADGELDLSYRSNGRSNVLGKPVVNSQCGGIVGQIPPVSRWGQDFLNVPTRQRPICRSRRFGFSILFSILRQSAPTRLLRSVDARPASPDPRLACAAGRRAR